MSPGLKLPRPEASLAGRGKYVAHACTGNALWHLCAIYRLESTVQQLGVTSRVLTRCTSASPIALTCTPTNNANVEQDPLQLCVSPATNYTQRPVQHEPSLGSLPTNHRHVRRETSKSLPREQLHPFYQAATAPTGTSVLQLLTSGPCRVHRAAGRAAVGARGRAPVGTPKSGRPSAPTRAGRPPGPRRFRRAPQAPPTTPAPPSAET